MKRGDGDERERGFVLHAGRKERIDVKYLVKCAQVHDGVHHCVPRTVLQGAVPGLVLFPVVRIAFLLVQCKLERRVFSVKGVDVDEGGWNREHLSRKGYV